MCNLHNLHQIAVHFAINSLATRKRWNISLICFFNFNMQKKMKPNLTVEQITVSNFLWQNHVLWLTFTRTMPQLKHMCSYGAWSVISHSEKSDIDWHPADRRDRGKLTIKRQPLFKYSFLSWTPWNRPLNSLCATVPSDQRSPTD